MAECKVLKCEECGHIFELLFEGSCDESCCDKVGKLMEPNTVDAALEKHVPVIEKIQGGYKVSVGSTLHPMEEKHYIMWIELIAGDQTLRQFLAPGQVPVAEFKCDAENVIAREFCNLHGLWKTTP